MNRDAEVWRSGAGPQDKLVSGIYMEAPMEGIPQRYRSILGPLSLFTECTQNKGRVEEQRPVIPDLEGPRVTPTSLKELCHLVQCRIQGQPAPSSTSHEDRQTLAELLMSELGLVWRDLNALSSDPSLSQKENNQLHSQIFSEVIRVCEEIYVHCLQMLDTTRERAIFSNQANLIRVRAQMAMACSSLLNIHTIKENVTLGIKTMRKNRLSAAESNEHSEQGLPDMHPTPRRMNLSQQPKSSSAKSRPSQQQKDTIENDLKEITEKIEDLDLKLVYDLVSFPTEITNREVTQCVAENTHGAVGQKDDLTTSPRLCRMQSCSSMPELQQQGLLEEMQMEGVASRPRTPLVLPATPHSPEPAKPIDPAEDLRRLLEDSDPHEKMRLKDPEADVPPLIKALTHRSSTKPQLLQQQQSLQVEHLPSQLENEEKTAEKVLVEEPEHPQSAVVDVMFPPNFMARLAVARVTDRVYTDTISMQPCPPICNHLTGELDFSSVEWLDRNLFEGAEITEVYRELSETISSKHLEFDNDPIFEPAMEDTSFRKSPSTKRKRPCFINPELKGQNPAKVSQRRRTKNQPYHERPQDVTSREYKVWLQWWKSHLSLEDYLNYISTQELDYLGAVFHLYDSDDDESKTRPLTLQQKESKKRKEKIDALKSKKGEFETGLWNVNSVMLGGLGKDPELEDDSPNNETPVSPKQKERGAGVGSARDKGSQRVQRPEGNQLQMRLEKLWRALCFPEGMRQDMALKYSSSTHRDQLQEAIVEWERTAQLIQQRETVLAQLEQFEKDASDPNRFFQQGYGGSSKARMDESKHREKLNSQMSALEKVLQRSIQEIKEHFNDTVTYRGRPYKEKMRRDRIEMLYWLQQERRIQALEKVVEGVGAVPLRLPPLESRQKRSCTNPAENPHPDPGPHCQRLL